MQKPFHWEGFESAHANIVRIFRSAGGGTLSPVSGGGLPGCLRASSLEPLSMSIDIDCSTNRPEIQMGQGFQADPQLPDRQR